MTNGSERAVDGVGEMTLGSQRRHYSQRNYRKHHGGADYPNRNYSSIISQVFFRSVDSNHRGLQKRITVSGPPSMCSVSTKANVPRLRGHHHRMRAFA